jgi:excinuclease UvrABC ATPase subunit
VTIKSLHSLLWITYETRKPFEGVVTNLERRWRETESDWAREEMANQVHSFQDRDVGGHDRSACRQTSTLRTSFFDD